MYKNDFREIVLIEVRKFLPEVPSWDDMARFVRIRGDLVDSPDQLDLADITTAVEQAAFYRYATVVDSVFANRVVDKPQTQEFIDLRTIHIAYATDVAYAEGLNQTEPRVFPPKSTTDIPMWKQRSRFFRRVWLQRGAQLWILPKVENDLTVFIYGLETPHYDANDQLVGLLPGDEYSLARYIAAEFLEPFQPQLAAQWKQECITEWVLQRQKHAWNARYRGRNFTRTVI